MHKCSPLLLFLLALSSGCVKKVPLAVPPPSPSPVSHGWNHVAPFMKATNIASVGSTFWVCGGDETIASSLDGGSTWEIRHQKRGGGTLLNISFLTGNIGHAAGQGGLLLSTLDGGRTWNSHEVGFDTVQAFSFADAEHGIAVLSSRRGSVGIGMLDEVQGVPFLDSHVVLTHDGGQDWEESYSLKASQELRPYTEVLSVAALNATHYLLGVRQPEVAVGYAVTTDAGKEWKLVHVDNVYATRVFIHDGEYWAFGIEYLDREKGGGYGVPVSLHSKDGEIWVHGARGPSEFPSCNPQGCYLSDGVVEDLYGDRVKFWLLPEDGAMTKTWAIAGDRACTIGGTIMCGPALASEHPPARPSD